MWPIMKQPKDALLKVRCGRSFKRDLEIVANLQGLDVADIVRMKLTDYVNEVLRSAAAITNGQKRIL